jgi:hypothetical protein
MQRRPFDWLTQSLVPIVGLLGAITGLLKDQPRIAGLLGLVVLLSLAGSLMPLLKNLIRSWRKSRRENRVARTAWPELNRLAETFGKFIDQGRSDTIHSVISQAGPQSAALAQLVRQYDFIPAPVLYGPWQQVSHGVRDSVRSGAELLRILQLFTGLVWTYHSYVIQPFFSRAPARVQEHLAPEQRQEAAMCRDKLTRFLDDYEALLARIASELPGGPFGTQSFPRIPPL